MSRSVMRVNGVDLCVDTTGDRRDPAILLIGGAAAAMDWWEDEFCERLAAGGRFVIRYDSRDTGQSVTYPAAAPRYTETDLATDAVAVLDALGLRSAGATCRGRPSGSCRLARATPLKPGASTALSFELKAVNAGRFNVYVVVLPNGASPDGTGSLAVSPPLLVTVAGRTTLSAGGALPVAVAVPVLLGLALAVARIRLRRTG